MNLPATSFAESGAEVYTLTLQNRLNELPRLSDWLNQLAGQSGLAARTRFRLELVLTEAVTNIIEHAYDDEALHDITITLQIGNRTVSLRVEDDGRPFNPLQHAEAVLPASLEEAGEGGLGIRLIRRFVDDSHYQRKNNKNILTMIVSDPTETQSQDAS